MGISLPKFTKDRLISELECKEAKIIPKKAMNKTCPNRMNF